MQDLIDVGYQKQQFEVSMLSDRPVKALIDIGYQHPSISMIMGDRKVIGGHRRYDEGGE